MPYYPPTAAPILASNLVTTSMLGIAVPKFALGLANGVSLWLPQIVVSTADVGSAGVGQGTLPFALPQPLLLTFLTESFTVMGLFGAMAPLKILGLSNGLAATLPTALIKTTHPAVGAGSGLASFSGPPPIGAMQLGFSQVGMVGPGVTKIATAIALGVAKAAAAFNMTVPIVGPTSPVGASGVGTGKVI